METTPSEFIRGSKGIGMLEKSTGKTVIGISAPSDKNLPSWLKLHPSYQVIVPSGRGECVGEGRGRGRGEG